MKELRNALNNYYLFKEEKEMFEALDCKADAERAQVMMDIHAMKLEELTNAKNKKLAIREAKKLLNKVA